MKPFSKPIYVTRPVIGNKRSLLKDIHEILESGFLTNHGPRHDNLERRLEDTLKTPHVSAFNNGTIALLVALRALDLKEGEVITTPFTFAATPHAISWNGLEPVFCDIDHESMNIDTQLIESLITPRTRAILAVHVFGYPCNVRQIQEIADRHNLKVIYDAAHAFATEIDGIGIGSFGDISMFSFHATKLFNTIEGGCLTYREQSLRKKIYLLRNFGIKNEDTVEAVGINGKLNEFQAAVGLGNLRILNKERSRRFKIKSLYDECLAGLKGIATASLPKGTSNSLQYYPIRIDKEIFGASRDTIYNHLKRYNVFARKYFKPLCSEFLCYSRLESSDPSRLPVAHKVGQEILCLPFYGSLKGSDVQKIVHIIESTPKHYR